MALHLFSTKSRWIPYGEGHLETLTRRSRLSEPPNYAHVQQLFVL